MIIDLGCGTRPRPGAVGVDANPLSGAEVIHDLDVVPYPFDDSVADEIYLDNVLEHLTDVVAVMGELHRIGRNGCKVRIDVPYFRSRWAAGDPTHRHQFSAESFAYFDRTHEYWDLYRYSEASFVVEKVVFNERWPAGGWRGRVAARANRDPVRYESTLAPLLPLDELTFHLRVDKP